MKFQHIVITRFCAYWPGHASYGDKEWLKKRYDLFLRYSKKALEEQSCQNFKQLIICDSRIDSISNPFSELKYDYEVLKGDVSWSRLVTEYINKNNLKNFIMTRLDSDDVIGKDFLATLQREHKKNRYGQNYIIDPKYIYRYDVYSKKVSKSYFSLTTCFASLLCYDGNFNKYFGSHTKIIKKYEIVDKMDLSACLTVHDSNTTTTMKGKESKMPEGLKNVFK